MIKRGKFNNDGTWNCVLRFKIPGSYTL